MEASIVSHIRHLLRAMRSRTVRHRSVKQVKVSSTASSHSNEGKHHNLERSTSAHSNEGKHHDLKRSRVFHLTTPRDIILEKPIPHAEHRSSVSLL